MSLPVWPATVKHNPDRRAFRVVEPHVPPAETDLEGGSKRRRPTTTVRRAVMAFTWYMTDAQYATFQNFYHETLVEGALRFQMPVFDAVTGFVTRTCMFKGMYQASRPTMEWTVSAELHIFGGPQ